MLYEVITPFLLALSEMPRSRLEQMESLEQLRVLESGASIYVEIVPHRSVGIDTADDYARFVSTRATGDAREPGVITSYSIHYTKLYERTSCS